MIIAIFDTETAGSANTPFAYNIGYIIYNTDKHETLVSKDFVVEQVWHNAPLFNSAYYASKRPIYVNRMRSRKIKMLKFGYICQEMIRDFNKYDVSSAYAYNSPFDDNVFNTNCDWYKCINPFDNIPIFDIRGYAHNFLIDDEYIDFCEKHEYFTEYGNYSTTAENVYRYVTKNTDFIEEHTALADSLIELEILLATIEKGAKFEKEYKIKNSIPRKVEKTMNIFVNKVKMSTYSYVTKISRNGNIYLTTK